MNKTKIPQIREEHLERMVNDSLRISKITHRRPYKFVLLEDSESKGYIRICTEGQSHNSIGDVWREAHEAGADPTAYQNRGGGFFKLISQKEPYVLRFYSESTDLGPFNKDLLERTLAETLPEKYDYEVEG